MLELSFWITIKNWRGQPIVLDGHRHRAMSLAREGGQLSPVPEHEGRVFWEVRGHGPQEVSELLGPDMALLHFKSNFANCFLGMHTRHC